MPHVDTPQSFCRAGVARADITPPVGTYHRMWGAATHDRSTGVHRPLTATVLAIRPAGQGGGGIVLASLDHCILDESDIANIRKKVTATTSFRESEIHVALTHTHGAGMMMRSRAGLPGGDRIEPYLDQMAETIAALAREAEAGLRDARIVYGTGRSDLAANRDFYDSQRGTHVCGFNPDSPADDTLLCARVCDDRGRTLATVVNYACHPTTLAWENTLISPDYLGAMREVIETATGGAPCLFLQGASAELGPREGFVGDTAVADRNGRRLGYSVLSVLEAMPPAGTRFEYMGPVVSGALLGTWKNIPLGAQDVSRASIWKSRNWTIELSYRPDLPTLAQTREEREKLLAEESAAVAREDAGVSRDLHARVEQMTRQITRLESLPPGDTFPLPISMWQCGGAIWVCVAGEHYSILQTTLRNRFPAVPIFLITIADGWQPGYLPSEEIYGKGIYQETIALVAKGSLERVIEEIAGQIAEWTQSLR